MSRRRIITYDLSAASARETFEQGLDAGEFDDDLELCVTRRGPQGSQQKLKQRNSRAQRDPAFQLRSGDLRATEGEGRKARIVLQLGFARDRR